MRDPRPLLTVLVILLLAASSRAGESIRPASRHANYLGLLVGPHPGRLVVGWIDESKGTGQGHDLVVLDLDGDGRPETRRPLEVETLDVSWILHRFSFEHEAKTYHVEFDGLAGPGSSPRLVSCDWTVLTSTESATFISGLALLTTSPLAAAFLPRIRLGPPFRFEVTTGIQGPDPILSVSLLDAMGGTLRLANREMEEIRPTVTLRRGDTLLLEATGEYG